MIPINPITLKLNISMTRRIFEQFMYKYLPALDYRITSEYRDPEKNRAVGGATDSAHLYGLAIDFVLVGPSGGALGPMETAHYFDAVIKPNWPGFALNEGDHIHVNLPRDYTTSTRWAGWLATAAGLAFAFHNLKKNKGKKYVSR